MTRSLSIPSPARQRGVALLVALMFLIVLTLLGLASMRTTTLEEKMAGGNRDYNLALQAAEAALRDAENDLKGPPPSGASTRTLGLASFPPTGGANACNAAALCYVGSDYTQLYNNTTFVQWNGATTTVYGTYTGAQPITGVSQPPRYVMELVMFHDGSYSANILGTTNYYVRVTARGWGASGQTVVTLQSLYLVPLS